jgi:hypothetical protein
VRSRCVTSSVHIPEAVKMAATCSDMQWLHALLDFRKLFDRLWANMGHVFHLIRIGVCRKIQPTNPAWSPAISTSRRLVKVDDNLLLCPKSEV